MMPFHFPGLANSMNVILRSLDWRPDIHTEVPIHQDDLVIVFNNIKKLKARIIQQRQFVRQKSDVDAQLNDGNGSVAGTPTSNRPFGVSTKSRRGTNRSGAAGELVFRAGRNGVKRV